MMSPSFPEPDPFTLRLERLALAVGTVFLTICLLSPTLHWDWLFDSTFLLAAGYHVLRPTASPMGMTPAEGATTGTSQVPWISLYLFLDAALQVLVGLCFPGQTLLFRLVLAGLYGLALSRRFAEQGLPARTLPWRRLFQAPARTTSLAIFVALACLYGPMLRLHEAFTAWTGPMVASVGMVTTFNAGHTVTVGGDVPVRGIQVTLSRAVGLALALVGSLHLLGLAGTVPRNVLLRSLRVAVVLIGAWWLLVAQGFQALGNLFNLAFVAGLGVLAAIAFIYPQKLPGDGSTLGD